MSWLRTACLGELRVSGLAVVGLRPGAVCDRRFGGRHSRRGLGGRGRRAGPLVESGPAAGLRGLRCLPFGLARLAGLLDLLRLGFLVLLVLPGFLVALLPGLLVFLVPLLVL